MYDMLVEATVTSIDYFAPIKNKKVRGNHTRYLSKDFSKAIMNRSRLKNYYNKNHTHQNRERYKRQRNYCTFF